MQDGGRDSKPGVGPKDLTAQNSRVIQMALMGPAEYRAVMTELLTTEPKKEG